MDTLFIILGIILLMLMIVFLYCCLKLAAEADEMSEKYLRERMERKNGK